MKIKTTYIALLVSIVLLLGSCQRNYYSGSGKGSNCGCPSKKGMVGY